MGINTESNFSPIRVMAPGASGSLSCAMQQADKLRPSIDEARRALRESPVERLADGERVSSSFVDLLDRQDWFNDRMVQAVLLEWTESEKPTVKDGQRIMYNGADAVFGSYDGPKKAWYISALQADDFPKDCPDEWYHTMANARTSVITEMLRVYRSGTAKEKQQAKLESSEQFHNALIALRQMQPERKAFKLDFNTLPSEEKLTKLAEITTASDRDWFATVLTSQADRLREYIHRHIVADGTETASGNGVIDQQKYRFEFKPGVMYEYDKPTIYSASTRNRNGEKVRLDFSWGWNVDNMIYDLQVGDTKLHYRCGDKAIHVENSKTGLNEIMLVPSREEIDAERDRQISSSRPGLVRV